MNNETIIELGFHMILRIMQVSKAGSCPLTTLHIILSLIIVFRK